MSENIVPEPGEISARVNARSLFFPRRMRAGLALASGRLARTASRALGRGSGGMIGGTIALAADPEILSTLAQSRRAALITGTNGKSTTTRMIAAALESIGAVASNSRGDNMPPGIVTALMTNRTAPVAALEVDEMHLPIVAKQVKPHVITLLNLSRDQLDRVGEIGTVERRLRDAVQQNPQAIVVANCDDPLIASAAWDARKVIWVAAGSSWGADSASFPRGGGRVLRDGDDWWVEGNAQYRRPKPTWWVEDEDGHFTLRNAEGIALPLQLKLPGKVNRANAAMAVAVATAFGVDPAEANLAVSNVDTVAGRYGRFTVGNTNLRLLLAKNPAGWQEALEMLDPEADGVVIAVNGQVADGEDLSWLWDVDFTALQGKQVYAAGQRGADLAVRLCYDDVAIEAAGSLNGTDAQAFGDPLEAIRSHRGTTLEVLANYTAFRDLLTELKELRNRSAAEDS